MEQQEELVIVIDTLRINVNETVGTSYYCSTSLENSDWAFRKVMI